MSNLKVKDGISVSLNSSETSEIISPSFLPGDIVGYQTTSTIPSGWISCDGQELSKITYSSLYDVIGTYYGETNGSGGVGTTHFKVPSLNVDTYYLGRSYNISSNVYVTSSHSHSGNTNYSVANHLGPTASAGNGHNHTSTVTHNSGTFPAHTHNTTNTTINSNSAASSNTGNFQIINTGTNYEIATTNHSHSDTFGIAFNTNAAAWAHTHSGGTSTTANSNSEQEYHTHSGTFSITASTSSVQPPFLVTRYIIKV